MRAESDSTSGRVTLETVHKTPKGSLYLSTVEDFLKSRQAAARKGKVHLIVTSPPFPLNRKKSYGNLQGEEYLELYRRIQGRALANRGKEKKDEKIEK